MIEAFSKLISHLLIGCLLHSNWLRDRLRDSGVLKAHFSLANRLSASFKLVERQVV